MDRVEGSPGGLVRGLAIMEAVCLVRQLILFVPKLGETHDAVMGPGKEKRCRFLAPALFTQSIAGKPT